MGRQQHFDPGLPSRAYEVNDETWSSTTFLIWDSISGVIWPLDISWRRGPWVAVR